MKYIADILTALRVLLAIAVLVFAWQDMWVGAVWLFIAGILTDAFDGIAARKWPYTAEQNARLWWRKNPHAFDNNADLALSTAGVVGLTLTQLSLLQAVGVMAAVGLTSFVIQSIVDRIGPNNPKWAERIDVAHGWLYAAELSAMLVWMIILATNDWRRYLVVATIAGMFLLFIKWDRVISRRELTYGA